MKIKEGQQVKYRGKTYKNIQGAWAEQVEQDFSAYDIDEMIEELTAWRDTMFDYDILDADFGGGGRRLIGWSTEIVSDNTAFRINEKLEKERESKLSRNKKAREDKERQDKATYERLKVKYD